MNYSNLFTVAGLLAGLQIAFVLISIIASTLSLVHALKESPKRASIIVFSSLGLAFGLLGFLFGLIFAFLGLVFTIISMTQDRKPRNYVALVISIVAITGVIGFGFSYYMNQVTNQIENQIENIESETIQNIGIGTGVHNSTGVKYNEAPPNSGDYNPDSYRWYDD